MFKIAISFDQCPSLDIRKFSFFVIHLVSHFQAFLSTFQWGHTSPWFDPSGGYLPTLPHAHLFSLLHVTLSWWDSPVALDQYRWRFPIGRYSLTRTGDSFLHDYHPNSGQVRLAGDIATARHRRAAFVTSPRLVSTNRWQHCALRCFNVFSYASYLQIKKWI